MPLYVLTFIGPDMPICIGSGITPENAKDFKIADAFIVGSFFKKGGKWQNALDQHRISQMVMAIENLSMSE